MKVHLIGQPSSQNRGVGFYHQFLSQSLGRLPEIQLVDDNPDLVHFTFFDLFYPTLPFYKNYPTVVTIHDLTPLVLSRLYPKGIRSSLNLLRQRLSLTNIRAIITDSQNSKRDLIRLLKIDPSIIFSVPLAVDPIYTRSITKNQIKDVAKRYHLPHEFVLTVAGGPNPNKNLPALSEATQALHIPLVMVGGGLAQPLPKGKVHAELRDLQRIHTYHHVVLPGFVPSDDLLAFYKLASVYCQPSFYEGFGLPILEAMTAGCLVISSNTSSLPEIYPSHTLTFNPYHPVELRQALETSLNLKDLPRQHYIRAGQQRAADFSWGKTAQFTLEVYKQILGK